jgi:hypothetical protein
MVEAAREHRDAGARRALQVRSPSCEELVIAHGAGSVIGASERQCATTARCERPWRPRRQPCRRLRARSPRGPRGLPRVARRHETNLSDARGPAGSGRRCRTRAGRGETDGHRDRACRRRARRGSSRARLSAAISRRSTARGTFCRYTRTPQPPRSIRAQGVLEAPAAVRRRRRRKTSPSTLSWCTRRARGVLAGACP